MREVEIRSLARVEKRPSLDSIAIESANLDAYLAERKFVARESQFAPYLDLGQHSRILERLSARGRKKGFVYSKRERDKMLKEAELIRRLYPESLKNTAIEQILYGFEVRGNMTGPVEHSNVIYFDTRKKAIKEDSIKIGEPGRCFPETYDLYMQGHKPMIEIHTHHPFDIIFSPDDYYGMLLNAGDGSPLVKSSIVLCPNLQVLGFATEQTPLLNKDDAWRLLEKTDVDIDQNIIEKESAVGSFDGDALINANLLGVSRMLSIKLYSSTDMRNFKAFSA